MSIVGYKPSLSRWKHDDCIMKVNFFDIFYSFYCIKNIKYNIYMNPFFHEYDITSFVYNTLRDEDVFVDVGAMGGLYTIIASRIVGSKGRVLSIEPNPKVIETLKKNISLNELDNVSVEECAVGPRYGNVNIVFKNGHEELAAIDNQEGNIPMVPLDDLTSRFGSIRVLKVDTEGYDEKILVSSPNTLKKSEIVIVEMDTPKIRWCLEKNGFMVSKMRPSDYILGKKVNYLK